MGSNQNQELKERLSALGARERKELTREASELRQRAQTTKGSVQAKWSIEQFMLQLLRSKEPDSIGEVIASYGERCLVRAEGRDTLLPVERSVAPLVPGDRVGVGRGSVNVVFARRTLLERTDPLNRRKRLAIVANVDRVVIVVSCVSPPLHPRLIDRYLAAIWKGGAEPAIVLNKTDLHEGEASLAEDQALLAPYRRMGIPVFEASANDLTGIERIRKALSSQTSVLVGHSGVGKSSLLNALVGVEAGTGAVSGKSSKGTHTTTASRLYEEFGMRIIDTPGVREFAIAFDSVGDIAACFREFPLGCRFSDCTHMHEDGCLVRGAVATGGVDAARYESYRRLVEDAFPEICKV